MPGKNKCKKKTKGSTGDVVMKDLSLAKAGRRSKQQQMKRKQQKRQAKKLAKSFATKLGISPTTTSVRMEMDIDNAVRSKRKKGKNKAKTPRRGQRSSERLNTQPSEETQEFERQQASLFERERASTVQWKRNPERSRRRARQQTQTAAETSQTGALFQFQPATFALPTPYEQTLQKVQTIGIGDMSAAAVNNMPPRPIINVSSLQQAAANTNTTTSRPVTTTVLNDTDKHNNPFAALEPQDDHVQHNPTTTPTFQFAPPTFQLPTPQQQPALDGLDDL